MPKLIAISPLADRAPIRIGACGLAEADPGPITSVAAFTGKDKALATALKAATGLAPTGPNRFTAKGPARMVWTARGQAFLIGVPAPDLSGIAAVTDQSDGWVCLRVEGPAAETVLTRLYPIDLRLRAFEVGHAARTPLNHLMSVLMRSGAETFDILVFRSMARTAWHEIETAMRGVAARG